MTGFTNLVNVTIDGKVYPLKYNITGGKVLGIVPDKATADLLVVLGSTGDKGSLIIELPRNVIDAKDIANKDTKFQVKIDNQGVDYQEVANNVYARVLKIDFTKNNRIIDIVGTQMAS
jgi:hypothetical protein